MKQHRTGRENNLLRVSFAIFLVAIALYTLFLPSSSISGFSPQFLSNSLVSTTDTEEKPLWLSFLASISPQFSTEFSATGENPSLETAEETKESAVPVLEIAPIDEHEDLESLSGVSADEVVPKLIAPTSWENYTQIGDVYIQNATSKVLDTVALAQQESTISLANDGSPQILIMHTHGSEAYAQDGETMYLETDTARTLDTDYNIIRVGDEIERIFTEMGLSVLHDENIYDYPDYNVSYDRSRAAVTQYLEDYPSIQIVLDIHRDALVDSDGTVYKPLTEIDGEDTAQVLIVMGSDDGGLYYPNWSQNLALALAIQETMNAQWPTLARPLTLRSSRYNQELTLGSILVEVGSHGNTLEEALRGARLFARSAGLVFLDLVEKDTAT